LRRRESIGIASTDGRMTTAAHPIWRTSQFLTGEGVSNFQGSKASSFPS